MSWRWIVRLDDFPAGPLAAARLYTRDGEPAGVLAVWEADAEPPQGAARIDSRLVYSAGESCWISWVRLPDGIRINFDGPEVVQATRDVLWLRWLEGMSTLVVEGYWFGGAVTVARGQQRHRLADDPFARLAPTQILRVDEGLFGAMPAPVGPVHQRYRAGNPWPWDRFD